jgi:phage gp36-like protein
VYCTTNDIASNVFASDLYDLTKSANDVSINNTLSATQLALIESLIAKADNEINDFCRVRYDVPFTIVPGTIKDISISITIYWLYSRSKDIEYDHPKRIRYNDAINRLKLIMGGNIVLDILPANISDSYLQIATNKNSESRIFTKKLLDQMP